MEWFSGFLSGVPQGCFSGVKSCSVRLTLISAAHSMSSSAPAVLEANAVPPGAYASSGASKTDEEQVCKARALATPHCRV